MTPEEEALFQVIEAIERNPESSQRELARVTGMSVGKTNSLIHALVEKGLLKIGKFYKARNKLSKIAYVLTPEGRSFRLHLTQAYLTLKRREFALLRAEIKALEQTTRSTKSTSPNRHV